MRGHLFSMQDLSSLIPFTEALDQGELAVKSVFNGAIG